MVSKRQFFDELSQYFTVKVIKNDSFFSDEECFKYGVNKKEDLIMVINNKEHRMTKPIYVTQPFLPPLEEFQPYLEKIWASHILTNGGPFHQELEEALASYLGVKYISLFSNGTLALITALQALQITGEVITTPFSFVATTHALMVEWHKTCIC